MRPFNITVILLDKYGHFEKITGLVVDCDDGGLHTVFASRR